ncbi:MAG: hypothetical protein COB60_07855 [Flavobacteriaceae bacterium]|nr:MAG: hypothetical protein COB60_07855 [Flavobacteriaceae bacterium]
MKHFKIGIIFVFFACNLCAQNNYNTKNGVIANGYDLVAYFSEQPTKGLDRLTFKYDGILFKFSTQENLMLFKASPKKYLPQYGGWCAYAIGKTNEKVAINPKTFSIKEGKLYLFYNAYFTNTFKLWKKEGPQKLIKQGDSNWQKLTLRN